MSSGIYYIKNKIDSKIYVGSSVNLKSREYKHFWMLNNGIHDNIHLQNAYNKFGNENFTFGIIEECDNKDLIERENFYIEKFKSNDSSFGYNLAVVNEFRRNTYNDEVKVKLSKYNLHKNNNFVKFSLTTIDTNEEHIFDNLVDAAAYISVNGFSKGKLKYIRMKISDALRQRLVNNGSNGSIRKTCYKHKFKIIE